MKLSILFVACAGLSFTPPTVLAQDGRAAEIEEVVVVGSRFQTSRSEAQATAPVDVLSGEQIGRVGNHADLTDSLRALAPSYNAPMASGDGDTFVRSTSLRGLAPDQTLVMVNGKRRHRAALIAEFVPAAGKGSHGPNIAMIPAIAVRSVEVLRDGAVAQYGSDAIAGVVNFRMKDAAQGGEVRLDYGQYYEGERSRKLAANAGFGLGADGFANLSFEFVDNEALSRGRQRPNAQALIDAGVPGIGADSPFDDAPLVQTWGRPQTTDYRFFLNAGTRVGERADLYLHANFASTEGRYRFFYRSGDNPLTDANEAHSTIRALGIEDVLIQGFTPFFDGDHRDFSVVAGYKGVLAGGTTYDLSFGYGEDELDFFLKNTVNPSIGLGGNGLPAQMDFDVGALKQQEINLNADFTRRLTDRVQAAYGVEWRQETFTVIAGEPNSYRGAGSSGFKGLEPVNSGEFDRDNSAVYGEIEQEVTDNTLAQYALRYESFSDFGSTLNGKLALRHDLADGWAARGSVNTGFHAPTPGQSNLQKVTTTFDNDTGLQVESGTVPPNHPLALAAGGAPLQEEQSIDYSAGLWFGKDRIELTADLYLIRIDGRIYKTQNLPVVAPNGIASNVQFFTNALDLDVTGLDIVFTTSFDWASGDITTDFTFAFNHNQVDVVRQSLVNGVQPVSDAEVEDIEHSYPNNRFTLTADILLSPRWDLMLRLNYYGEHYDERGRIDGVDGGAPTKLLSSTVFVDAELAFEFSDEMRFTLGASNLFDAYIDVIDAPYANRLNVGLPYARRTAANFEGGSWYLRGSYRW
ncbi:MAG: TonB-dependent receptor [Gammaproteobacteria bacterium]|nr:TonB-dependent receptor [Gammaproteobacteria bacterium]MDE0440665.1 TonB-dependent receptor [Gammaproteobacteria bacterium]